MKNNKNGNDFSEFLNIGGNEYYLDLEELSAFIKIERNENIDALLTKEENGEDQLEGQIIDIVKWETTKVLVETILNETAPVDEAMGFRNLSEQFSIPFKISFNTLLNYKIIKEQNGR